jgi:hypothetical protein
VFGNDGYQSGRRVGRAVELVRRWLTAAGPREQGFGVGPDGHSWAMLVRVDDLGYRTFPGRACYAGRLRRMVRKRHGAPGRRQEGREGQRATREPVRDTRFHVRSPSGGMAVVFSFRIRLRVSSI